MTDTQRPKDLITMRDLRRVGSDSKALSRGVARGEQTRIKRGAYVSTERWTQMAERDRQLARIYATAESHPNSVFGHESAAALLGLPVLGGWRPQVDVVRFRATGGRSETGVRRHCTGLEQDDVVIVDGLKVTSVIRTLVDLGRNSTFARAVAAADSALNLKLVSPAELADACDRYRDTRGWGRMCRAFDFADGLADNPGESLSRVRISELGFPAPALQVSYPRGDGGVDIVDFAWPDLRHIGEFDGKGKYIKDEFLQGMEPGEAVYREKRREDRLRSAGNTVSRWGWSELWNTDELTRILLNAGLPVVA